MKTFKQIEQNQNALMIVDALNLAFRYKHSGARNFAEDYLRTVQSLSKEAEARQVGNFIADVLDNPNDPDNIAKVRAQVAELTKRFPVYG